MTIVQYGDGWEINLKVLIKWIKNSTKNHMEVMNFDTVELVDEIKTIIKANKLREKKAIFPNKCPNCKSENLDFGDFDFNSESQILTQKITCEDCDKEFLESFQSINWKEVN